MSDTVMGQRDRNIREDRWWATFNAVLCMPLEEGETNSNPCLTASLLATDAHGFTPDSYNGPVPGMGDVYDAR